MFDQLLNDVLANSADLIFEMVFIALAGVATWAMNTLRQKLGAERAAVLRRALDEALDRAIDKYREKGLSDGNLAHAVGGYLQDTMADTLAALKATPETLAERVSAQIAQRINWDKLRGGSL